MGHTTGSDAGRSSVSGRSLASDAQAGEPTASDRRLKERLLSGTGGAIGRFVVLRELGEGNMGLVFAAYDAELDRKVAIKLLRSTPGEGSIGRDRLLREAQALARLSHPNVVTVYEVGEFEQQVFLAMEFVEGPTLLQWLRDAPRDYRAVLRVFVEAGRGLAAAHAAEILHRDFKPSNVLIGVDGRVRVADFGLAQDRREPDAAASSNQVGWSGSLTNISLGEPLTIAGTIVGTPSYMAPERFVVGAPVDARADQFSFCVALYEALYGERPFHGATFGELRDAVLSRSIVAPREAPVPAWLRKVVLRGLARDPAARFPSMQALIDALERDPARTRRWVVAGVGAAALLVAGGYVLARAGDPPPPQPSCQDARPLLAAAWDDRRADVERALLATQTPFAADTADRVVAELDRWADAWAAAHVDACAAHVRGEQSAALLDLRMTCLQRRRGELVALLDRLAVADTATVRAAVAAVDQLTPIERCADAEALTAAIPPPADPTAAARVAALRDRLAEARAAGWTRKHAEGLAIVKNVVTEAKTLAYRPLLAEALVVRGDLEDASGDYEAARASLQEGLWLADVCGDDVLLAKAMSALMVVLGERQAKFEEALRWRPHADAVVMRAGEGTTVHAMLLGAVGTTLARSGRTSEALQTLALALALTERLFAPGDRVVLDAVRDLGNAHFFHGQAHEAQALYRRALTIAEETYGPHHPEIARLALNLGAAHLSVNEVDAAQGHLERALAISEAALGPDHPELSPVLSNLGTLLTNRGEFRRARALIVRAIAIDERALGPDHPDLATSLLSLGQLDAALGDYAAARPLARRCLEIRERSFGTAHPLAAEALLELGSIELADGAAPAAQAWLERALTVVEGATEGANPALGPQVRFTLAKALRLTGEGRRAEALAGAALTEYRALDPEDLTHSIAGIEAWRAAAPPRR